MAKTKKVTFLGVIAWITGILVSLAVGFGMAGQTLTVPFLHPIFSVVAGWIVIVGALLSVFAAIVALFQR